MITHFLLPDLGEGLPEAELVSWLVAVGDTVSLNQCIAEVETAKAVVELPSPHAGVVQALHAAAGDVVAVGTPLISYDVEMDAVADVAETAVTGTDGTASTATTGAGTAPPNLVGYGPGQRPVGRPARRPRRGLAAPSPAPAHEGPAQAAAAQTDTTGERPRSTPPVRKFAKDRGIDLAAVAAASASHGVITRADVEAFAGRAGSSTATAPRQERTTRIPIRGVRKATAEAMVGSAFTAPHVTTFLTVDVSATMRLIASLAADHVTGGGRIGVLAVAAKAVCLALRESAGLNSAWDGATGDIVQHHFVNLGIAAATSRGLVVPNIKDADALSLAELAASIGELADTARAGKTRAADMSGGTFSITNVGVFGIDAGTPIINPGEAGILALGAVRKAPWEHRGEIALRDVMTLSLSFDHRLVDGQEGAQFLATVGGILREPGRAMLLR